LNREIGEVAIYARAGRRRDLFSMSGNDPPVSGLSSPSSGGEAVSYPIHAANRPFSSIRYFSDASRGAAEYTMPVTVGYELISPIRSLLEPVEPAPF
jgi:hypothetical protein